MITPFLETFPSSESAIDIAINIQTSYRLQQRIRQLPNVTYAHTYSDLHSHFSSFKYRKLVHIYLHTPPKPSSTIVDFFLKLIAR